MPFFIKRNEVGEIATMRYIFHIDGTEFEDFCDRGFVNVIADDESPVTDEDRAKVAELYGEYLGGRHQQPFPMD